MRAGASRGSSQSEEEEGEEGEAAIAVPYSSAPPYSREPTRVSRGMPLRGRMRSLRRLDRRETRMLVRETRRTRRGMSRCGRSAVGAWHLGESMRESEQSFELNQASCER